LALAILKLPSRHDREIWDALFEVVTKKDVRSYVQSGRDETFEVSPLGPGRPGHISASADSSQISLPSAFANIWQSGAEIIAGGESPTSRLEGTLTLGDDFVGWSSQFGHCLAKQGKSEHRERLEKRGLRGNWGATAVTSIFRKECVWRLDLGEEHRSAAPDPRARHLWHNLLTSDKLFSIFRPSPSVSRYHLQDKRDILWPRDVCHPAPSVKKKEAKKTGDDGKKKGKKAKGLGDDGKEKEKTTDKLKEVAGKAITAISMARGTEVDTNERLTARVINQLQTISMLLHWNEE
jgi:hypothetical protein